MLRALARSYGIHLSYRDMSGQCQETSPDTLKALLKLWDIATDTAFELREALRERKERAARQVLPLALVAWDGKAPLVHVNMPPQVNAADAHSRIYLEDGTCMALNPLIRKVGGGVALQLPPLPFGYHQLELERRHRLEKCLVISAPQRSYAPPGFSPELGLFLPMYAAHSKASWGAGNIRDWQKLARWAAARGARLMAGLPLLAGFMDGEFCEPSPYSPASRLFWNEFYLDIPHAREFSACAEAQRLFRSAPFQAQIETFRKSPLIDYPAQMAARRKVLEPMAAFFFAKDGARGKRFEAFLRSRPEAVDYACFRAACEQTRTPWRKWETRMRYGKLQPGDFAESTKNYHLYVQWLAEEQMNRLAERCRALGVRQCLDVPLGVHPDGYDLWREHDAFAYPARAGAPPDPYFPKGQDWGFAPLHPHRLRERGYDYMLRYLRFQMRHCELLRLDHVMALHRLYWIPPGFSPDAGAYVGYPADELYAILSLESHRHQTRLLGENLGTVPAEVNAAMRRHRLHETYVLQYEQRPRARTRLRAPALSTASLNTHDMPTFTAYWRGRDIDERARLGLIPTADVSKEQVNRVKATAALASFLRRKGLLNEKVADTASVLRACLQWLSSSDAETVLVNLEDLWLEEEPQNVPGTSSERPNWRRKARLSLEQIQDSRPLRELLAPVARKRSSK